MEAVLKRLTKSFHQSFEDWIDFSTDGVASFAFFALVSGRLKLGLCLAAANCALLYTTQPAQKRTTHMGAHIHNLPYTHTHSHTHTHTDTQPSTCQKTFVNTLSCTALAPFSSTAFQRLDGVEQGSEDEAKTRGNIQMHPVLFDLYPAPHRLWA